MLNALKAKIKRYMREKILKKSGGVIFRSCLMRIVKKKL